MSGPRVRFAPSPTGFFHVGSARTALFNYFIARQSPEGVFLLRIEDTDEERNREEWVDGIVEAMRWLGMSPDEGPFRQSDNRAAHNAAIEALLSNGRLYYCDCTHEQVTARKGDNKTPGYDGFCRDRGLVAGASTALRFRTPDEGAVIVPDLIRGDVEFSQRVLDDFVVAKSSGAVLFSLANVVDDRNDRITHVIRGEEHLPNTPRQMMLWGALNDESGVDVPLPVYAHLPLLVNEQRKKLSKRKDPVATELYRDQGYLPAAFLNYLALLGWSPRGEDEVVPFEELVREFRLEDVSHSPAFFDVKKLTHLNGEYIRQLSSEQFLDEAAPWVTPESAPWRPREYATPWPTERFRADVFAAIAPLVQERIARLDEIPAMVDFLFTSDAPYDEAAFDKAIRSNELSRQILATLVDELATAAFSPEELHALVAAVGERFEVTLRKAQAPVRVALTGRTIGPPLFEAMVILGRDEVRDRLGRALARC